MHKDASEPPGGGLGGVICFQRMNEQGARGLSFAQARPAQNQVALQPLWKPPSPGRQHCAWVAKTGGPAGCSCPTAPPAGGFWYWARARRSAHTEGRCSHLQERHGGTRGVQAL